MYISKVYLKHVRCCDEITINFDKPGSSVLFCGDNGDGKSTILRCIAMGLCDQTSAAGLLRELPGDLVKRGKEDEGAQIVITLRDSSNKKYEIHTNIKSLKAFESLKQTVFINEKEEVQDKFPWHKIFVTAYGPGNRISGTADYQHYVGVDAVYSLFRNDVPLQNPELVIRRAVDESYKMTKKRSTETLKYLQNLLNTLLNLETKDQIFLTKTGIEIKSARWGRSELGALGDGYKSVTTLILDLISWWMLNLNNKPFYSNRNIRGIVLIDEVEQHLHPRWQTKIMQLLNDSFEHVQFIATTHSPLVISGCKDIPVNIISRGKIRERNVYGWLAEDVYQEVMGLDTSRPEPVRMLIKRYEKLHLESLHRKLSKLKSNELKKIRQELKLVQGSESVAMTTELMNLTRELKKSQKK
jgi:predicted ATP-binding protein involved in virulence